MVKKALLSNVAELKLQANAIRQDIITSLHLAKSGHPGGALGMADIFTVLYFNTLAKHNQTMEQSDIGLKTQKVLKKHNGPKRNLSTSTEQNDPQRDRVILSAGHICPVLYATLAHKGYFNTSLLKTLRKLKSPLQGHPHRTTLPGLETTSGPLGSGLSQAAGMALVFQRKHNNNSSTKSSSKTTQFHLPRFFVIAGDGEQNEGNHWEAVMFAAKEKLSNVICITDRNKIQLAGDTKDIMPLGDLKAKYESFGWDAIEIDGHNYKQIISALDKAYQRANINPKTKKPLKQKPLAIIANTIPGKGVDFMEKKYQWHGTAPNDKQTKNALDQLKAIQKKYTK